MVKLNPHSYFTCHNYLFFRLSMIQLCIFHQCPSVYSSPTQTLSQTLRPWRIKEEEDKKYLETKSNHHTNSRYCKHDCTELFTPLHTRIRVVTGVLFLLRGKMHRKPHFQKVNKAPNCVLSLCLNIYSSDKSTKQRVLSFSVTVNINKQTNKRASCHICLVLKMRIV